VKVAPLLLGPRNAEQATGLPWRFVRDHARALGVEPVRIGRKLAIPASAFLEALQRQQATKAERDPSNDSDTCGDAASLRRRLGLRLAGGNG
jgi:hypothetical protein